LPVTTNSSLSKCIIVHFVVLLAMAQASPSQGMAVVADANPPDTTAVALNWRSLVLRNAGWTGSVTTRIEQRALPLAEVQPALLDAPATMSPGAAGPRIQELVVTSSIRLLLGLRIETEERLWFNADDGWPLQLTRLRRGSKPSFKSYRFGSHQVYRLRRQPADKAEIEQPAEHWSEVGESFYPLAGADAGCPTILESSQLLYLLTSPGRVFSEQAVELCVFDRQRVYRVGVREPGREQVEVDYRQVVAGQESQVRDILAAHHVVLDGRPVEVPAADAEPFSFLGLQGDIHLLLSDPGRIPLRVRGQVPGFGMIDLELETLTQ